MSAFSQAMKRVAERLRRLQSPAVFDIVTSSLTIRTRTWVGGLPQADGGYRDEDFAVAQNYPVVEMSSRDVAGSGGRYQMGDVKIGPITPDYVTSAESGGYSIAQLRPEPNNDAIEVLYLLDGNEAGEYQLVDADFADRFEYFLVLRRRTTTP